MIMIPKLKYTVYKENQDYLLSRNRTLFMQDGSAENFLPS